MNSPEDDLAKAVDVAMQMTRQFDFDCREVLSSEAVCESEGRQVFRIVARLWTSDDNIDETISRSGKGQDADLMREILAEGNKICIEATSDRVINYKWLGVQFS